MRLYHLCRVGFDDCCGGARFGAATIDEVVIFDVALEQADIEELLNGMHSALAIDPADKMATTWASVKIKY